MSAKGVGDSTYGINPLHYACQHHARDLGVLGLRWVPTHSKQVSKQYELKVVEGGMNDALHDALVMRGTARTRPFSFVPNHSDGLKLVSRGEGHWQDEVYPSRAR